MTDLIDAIVTRLKADPAICAIVGTSPDQRIYRRSFPKLPAFPCLVVMAVSGNRTVRAHNKGCNGMTRIQVTAFATGDDTAFALSDLVANSLNVLTNTALSGAYVIRIKDQGIVPDVNLTAGIYLYHRDFLIEHNV